MSHRRHHLDQQSDRQDDGEAHARSEPTWFLDTSDLQQREELMLRYRRSRNLPDPTLRPSQPGASDRPSYHAFISAQPRPPARFLESTDTAEETRNRSDAAPRGRMREMNLQRTFIAAAAMAVVAGGMGGFLSAKRDTIRNTLLATLDSQPRRMEVVTPVRMVTATVIAKKPVATATLQVTDVTGKTNSLIPLALRAAPALAGQDLFLRISGLPERAYLTSGRKEDDQAWTLGLDDLKDVKLLVPDARQETFDVDVAAFERQSGELAAPVKTMTVALQDVVIQPASAPAQEVKPPPLADEAGARVAAIPAPDSTGLGVAARDSAVLDAARGDRLLAEGDVDEARAAYEAAWRAGSPEGAFGLARSYDPVVLATLGIASVRPDATRAIEWYGRAAGSGKRDATTSIVRLRMKPD